MQLARTARELTSSRCLVLAGGVALNCVANGKVQDKKIFDEIWIQPAAGDAGGALGAALAACHIWKGEKRTLPDRNSDAMRGAYLGPQFDERDIDRLKIKFHAVCEHYPSYDQLCTKTARLLAEGNVVGWFQGRMEWGPRALGNRSILADPRSPEMQKHLNLKIKFRESFRPFAPSVLMEDASDYFDLDTRSPYMLLVAPVTGRRRKAMAVESADIRERLYHLRSDVPAITHIDYSARIQTVHRETNERYWRLIQAFKQLTGYGLLVNTSFNVRGEPIVCTPQDAYQCFMRTDMDCLVVNDCLFEKSKQPEWKETRKWMQDFQLD